jgi:hypothetical protein
VKGLGQDRRGHRNGEERHGATLPLLLAAEDEVDHILELFDEAVVRHGLHEIPGDV